MNARLAEYRSLEQGIEQEIDGNRIRMDVLQKELVHSQGNEVTVSAPCAGTILALRIKSPGAVVQQGETLCELGCSGERLQAEVTIPESGVMRIRPGHGVKLLYDAFPYQRYGVRYGNVRWVSPASVLQNSVPVFHVMVAPQEDVVMIKGQPRPLMPGMGGRAQVVVDKRSLISYAFAPIRQLKETLAKPPEKSLSP